MKIQKYWLCLVLPLQAIASEGGAELAQNEQLASNSYENSGCCDPCVTSCDPCCYCFSMQFDVSYFRPNSSRLREFYGSAWVNYKLEFDFPFSLCCSCFSVFADVSYASAEGHSRGGAGSCFGSRPRRLTRIRNVPISLGLKWIQPFCGCFNFYLGAGARYYFTRIHNYYPFVKSHVNKNGWGGVVLGGVTYDICGGLFLDMFASWSYMRFGKPTGVPPNISRNDLQVGGLDIGAGLGWKF